MFYAKVEHLPSYAYKNLPVLIGFHMNNAGLQNYLFNEKKHFFGFFKILYFFWIFSTFILLFLDFLKFCTFFLGFIIFKFFCAFVCFIIKKNDNSRQCKINKPK